MPGLCLLIISWIPPVCALGFSQTPIISNPLHLSKVIWPLIIGQTKTALGSASPDEGPGCLQTFIPPFPCRLPSLWAELLRGATSRQIPAPISSPGILISRAVNYINGHPLPSPLAPLSPWAKLLALLGALWRSCQRGPAVPDPGGGWRICPLSSLTST